MSAQRVAGAPIWLAVLGFVYFDHFLHPCQHRLFVSPNQGVQPLRTVFERLFPKERRSSPGRFFAAAPTRDQAKRIWWQDLNDLVKPDWKAVVSASELKIRTTRGAEDWVIGLDKPMRMEGVLGGCGSSIDVSADPRLFPDQRPTPMLCWFPSGAAPSKEI